jgi:hypothetical protein
MLELDALRENEAPPLTAPSGGARTWHARAAPRPATCVSSAPRAAGDEALLWTQIGPRGVLRRPWRRHGVRRGWQRAARPARRL